MNDILYLMTLSSMLLARIRIHALSAPSSYASFIRSSKLSRRTLNSKSSDEEIEILSGVSRVKTLQTLLSLRGAPGSRGCNIPNGDLVPVLTPFAGPSEEYHDLHPYLIPLAKSQSTGNVVCALRRAYSDTNHDDLKSHAPWPIVESAVDLPGMKLLSMNSEHIMRRIAADSDVHLDMKDAKTVIDIYNDGLGTNKLTDNSSNTPYVYGSVSNLGYGLDKYVLLKIGPFPDLYETMANVHLSRGDIESALIAAEASNGKFVGFGSTFAFYAKLLASLPQRSEEARDAARMCVRMPLSSMGLTRADFANVSKIAMFANSDDSTDIALKKMLQFYERVREQGGEEEQGEKTAVQSAVEEANYLLDIACLNGQKYGDVRGKIAHIYRAAGLEKMSGFIERS